MKLSTDLNGVRADQDLKLTADCSIIAVMSLSQEIKCKTVELGFDLAGVTDAAPIGARQADIFAEWLKSGFAGQMDYMHRNLDKRLAPAGLLKNAKSIIVVGLNYTLPACASELLDTSGQAGRVARYAQYQDYHLFIRERLRRLVGFIASLTGGSFGFKICVDSVPLAERTLAARAGLGFIGKNHMLINPELGCEIFLGEIITDLELSSDRPMARQCGDCTKCLDACPTGALRTDGQFDAGRCINYLTIEHRGSIAPELAGKMGNRLFGCDECVLACPYQNAAPVCKNKQFKFYPDRAKLDLQEVSNLNEKSFETRFADSPIARAGLDGLKRNAAICLANMTGQL